MIAQCPPKAKVVRSNRIGRAIKSIGYRTTGLVPMISDNACSPHKTGEIRYDYLSFIIVD